MIFLILICSLILWTSEARDSVKVNNHKWNFKYHYNLQEPFLAPSNHIAAHSNQHAIIEPRTSKPLIHESIYSERIIPSQSLISYSDKNIYGQHRQFVNDLRNEILAEFQNIEIPTFEPNLNIPTPIPAPPPSPPPPPPPPLPPSSSSLPGHVQFKLNYPKFQHKSKPSPDNNYKYFYWHPHQVINLPHFESYHNLDQKHDHTSDLGQQSTNNLETNPNQYGQYYTFNQINQSPINFPRQNDRSNYQQNLYPQNNYVNNLLAKPLLYYQKDYNHPKKPDTFQNVIDQYFVRLDSTQKLESNDQPSHFINLKTRTSNGAQTWEKINSWDVSYHKPYQMQSSNSQSTKTEVDHNRFRYL